METIFRQNSSKIKIYLATEIINDPTEKTVNLNYLNPLPIDAIVTDLDSTSAMWKMPGIIISRAKQLIIEEKNKNLLEQSYRIEIDGDFYYGWKKNGKLNYIKQGNYLRVYCYIERET